MGKVLKSKMLALYDYESTTLVSVKSAEFDGIIISVVKHGVSNTSL